MALIKTNNCISLLLLTGMLEEKEQKMGKKGLMKISGKIRGKLSRVLIKTCFISVIKKMKIIVINEVT